MNTLYMNFLAVTVNWSNLWQQDYINRWDLHLTTYWVPAIVGVIFLVCAVQALSKRKTFLTILYVVLVLACLGVILTGSESSVINAVENVVGHE